MIFTLIWRISSKQAKVLVDKKLYVFYVLSEIAHKKNTDQPIFKCVSYWTRYKQIFISSHSLKSMKSNYRRSCLTIQEILYDGSHESQNKLTCNYLSFHLQEMISKFLMQWPVIFIMQFSWKLVYEISWTILCGLGGLLCFVLLGQSKRKKKKWCVKKRNKAVLSMHWKEQIFKITNN